MSHHHRLALLGPCMRAFVFVSALAGCSMGPDFLRPAPAAPADWTSWRSADDALVVLIAIGDGPLAPWWRAFGDPVLDRLQARAAGASPDLQTALLRFGQARLTAAAASARSSPELSAGGGAVRQRQSEHGAGTRVADAIGGERARLAEVLSAPFTLRQGGFDASWEPDLWGRVRRSVEAAEADVAGQAALLDLAHLSLASELARHYLELRTTQRHIALAREDIAALTERLGLLEARAGGGMTDQLAPASQRAELAAVAAQLPALLAQEGAAAGHIALLLGERPGALRAELASPAQHAVVSLPDLALGLPSDVARRRPDIRAAEARLHRATADIGIAVADLYPRIRLGVHAGVESYLSGELSDWGSRAWSLGPGFSLPLFDGGRRKRVVALRELAQQEAAVHYQQTVLKAWQEIDEVLSAYAADRQQVAQQAARVDSARDALGLAQARYDGGGADFIAVLDSRRGYLQARRDLAAGEGRLQMRYVAINKATAATPPAGAGPHP